MLLRRARDCLMRCMWEHGTVSRIMRGIHVQVIVSVFLVAGCGCDKIIVGDPPPRDTGADEVTDGIIDVAEEEVFWDVLTEEADGEVDVPEDCDDDLYCNGVETRNPTTGECEPGTEVDCSGFTDQCNVGVCSETVDFCVAEPLPDTTACDDGNICTEADHCDGLGACTGTSLAGTDWWEILPAAPISARSGPSVVWTGSQMLVWGGNDGTTRFGDGALYSPSSRTWSTVGGAGAPSARNAAAALWTGSEVIVWGGTGSGGVLGDGAMYDPSTDTWRDMSSAGAPSARTNVAVVWTGSEMIVWGGSTSPSGGPFVDSGARFDPSIGPGGVWVLLPATTGTPSARGASLAAWTGSEMIVWGGASGTMTAHDDGASFDPATGTWTPLPESRLPGRYQSTGVWTGTDFLFWGGWDFNTSRSMSDGAKHLVGTSSWLPLSASPLPTGHARHSVVWTGAEMIVWGGHNYGGSPFVRNDGARYDPFADTWTMMTLDTTITARTHHGTAWTGQQMLVFGGGDGGGGAITTAVGAAYTYCPLPGVEICDDSLDNDVDGDVDEGCTGYIAYDSTASGYGEVWIMDEDGSDVRQLSFSATSTAGGHGAWGPHFSHSGDRIAFNYNMYSAYSVPGTLHTVAPDGGFPATLLSGLWFGPSAVKVEWSVDDSEIIYNLTTGTGGGSNTTLRAVAPDGSGDRFFYDDPSYDYIENQDVNQVTGQIIYFPYTAGGNRGGIRRIEADGSGMVNVLSAGGEHYSCPRWSPSGRWISYTTTETSRLLQYVDSSGAGRTTVYAATDPIGHATWVREDAFVFAMRSGDHYDLYWIDRDGRGLVNLTNTPSHGESNPTWFGPQVRESFEDASPGTSIDGYKQWVNKGGPPATSTISSALSRRGAQSMHVPENESGGCGLDLPQLASRNFSIRWWFRDPGTMFHANDAFALILGSAGSDKWHIGYFRVDGCGDTYVYQYPPMWSGCDFIAARSAGWHHGYAKVDYGASTIDICIDSSCVSAGGFTMPVTSIWFQNDYVVGAHVDDIVVMFE